MKLLFFTGIVFAISFSTFSQDDQKKWSLQANLIPSFSFSNYIAEIDSPIHDYIADLTQKNDVRRPHLTLGGSVQMSYWITNSLRINSGISYTGYGERYHTTFYDQAPTVLEVFTQKLHITEHYLGIPLSFSAHFLKKQKSSLYATLGCDFEFLIFESEVLRTRLVNHANNTDIPQRTFQFRGRNEKLDQFGVNGFSPSLSASFGIDFNISSKSRLRIGPHAKYMLRPYQEAIAKLYFYNVGFDITYVFTNW